ncbi:hypothetical protein [Cognatilysobacter bugurensis]|nr:hypothetical protein [Lysobacter bugurensis]
MTDDRAPEVVFVPVPSGVSAPSIESTSRRDDGAGNLAPPINTAAAVRAAPPPDDVVALASLPAGPEGEAGLVAAVRAGTLRPANPSDFGQWVARHTAQGGTVDSDALQSSLRAAYVVLGDFTIPGGLHGAHSVTFIVPDGVPYPLGNPGHSVVLDVASGACMGFVCPSAGR